MDSISLSDLKTSLEDGLDQQKSIVDQKEAELKELQDQNESHNQMVKQLAAQREMAIKKLAEMDAHIAELNKVLNVEKLQVEAKDKELKTKRTQLQTLKNEENELKEKFDNYKKELNETTENLSSICSIETEVNTKLKDLQDYLKMANEAIEEIERATAIKDTIKLSALCDKMLPSPPLSNNNTLMNKQPKQSRDSPNFDPFEDEDPFDSNPFDDFSNSAKVNVALPEDDPFNPTSSAVKMNF